MVRRNPNAAFSVRSFAAIALLLVGVAGSARATIMTYTLSGGTMDGSYTLGGTTTNFTNAAVTYAVTADSSLAVAGTFSNSGLPLYYLPVSSVTVTLTEGSNTTIFSAGTQTIQYNGFSAPASMAVISYDAPPTYSGIGFGAVDVVPNADNPTNSTTTPYGVSLGQGLQGGSAVYTDLQTLGSFAAINFVPIGSLQVSSGGQTGTLDSIGASGAATMNITAVPEPSTYVMALAGIACGGYLVRRRRKRA